MCKLLEETADLLTIIDCVKNEFEFNSETKLFTPLVEILPEKASALQHMRMFFDISANHLQSKLPLNNPLSKVFKP